ncbi:MAG: hypothetical protein ACREUT_00730 [Steroidobacteraceae bacterium]
MFHSSDLWAAQVEDGREVVGTLNRRYDLCGLECGSPAPWLAAAYDTTRRELILAELLPERGFTCERIARACEIALGETRVQLDCY